MIEKVSVVGLGKLGASMAAAIASRGFDVIGVDVVESVIDKLNNGIAPVREPMLQDLISANRPRISATTSFEAAVRATDVTFVIVPTPSEPSGAFSLSCVSDAMSAIGRALAEKNAYHIVCLTSTVLPGASEMSVVPLLEAASGKHCGSDFGYCYSPEFIALGSVIRDFLNPDFVLIGEADTRSGDELTSFYRRLMDGPAEIARMSCANAELAKLCVNTYVTMKIAFANTVAEICQRVPGGDVDAVTNALGFDSRIGGRYLKGAMGYGGPCFPRDNIALSHLAESVGVSAVLAESTDSLNRQRAEQIIRLVAGEIEPSDTVAILGLSYKPSTDVIEESQGMYLARALLGRGHSVMVHDPLALERVQSELGARVQYAHTLADVAARADVIILANPDQSFRALGEQSFTKSARPPFVLDCWRLLRDQLSGREDVRYRAVGVFQNEGATGERNPA